MYVSDEGSIFQEKRAWTAGGQGRRWMFAEVGQDGVGEAREAVAATQGGA